MVRALFFSAILLQLWPGSRLWAQSDNRASENASHPYRISPETTRISGPLRQNGTLDFYAAINKRMSEGVTAKNNAARLIYGTWSPNPKRAEINRIRTLLGCDSLPSDYPRQVRLETFIEQHKCPELGEQYLATLDNWTAWDPDEYPLLARYIAANSPAIDAIVKATRLERFHVPVASIGQIADEEAHGQDLVPDETNGIPEFSYETLLAADVTHIQELRSFARLMGLRALSRIGASDYESAWSDILAMRRLGRFAGQQSSLVEGLVGVAITGMACRAASELIDHATRTNQPRATPDWGSMLRQWGDTFETADLQLQFDFGERLAFIEYLTLLADDRIRFSEAVAGIQAMAGEGTTVPLLKLMDEVVRTASVEGRIDWNEGLRWSNTLYDRVIANHQIEDPRSRQQAHKALSAKLDQLERFAIQNLQRLGADDATPEERGKILCGIFLIQLVPITDQVENAERRIRSWQQVVALGLASLRYHEQLGSYPDSLETVARQYAMQDMLRDSGHGREILLDETYDEFRIEYKSHTSRYLDFDVTLVTPDDK